MAHNRTITSKMSEGCKPSALPDRRIRQSGHGRAEAEPSHVAGESTIADACSLTHSPTITRSPSPKASAKERRDDADDRLPPCRPADRPGCGGLAGRAAAGPRNARGPLAQTQSGFGVGDRYHRCGNPCWSESSLVVSAERMAADVRSVRDGPPSAVCGSGRSGEAGGSPEHWEG